MKGNEALEVDANNFHRFPDFSTELQEVGLYVAVRTARKRRDWLVWASSYGKITTLLPAWTNTEMQYTHGFLV